MQMEHPDHDRVHRITDAYREEQRENREDEPIELSTDAIKWLIDAAYNAANGGENVAFGQAANNATEELTALVAALDSARRWARAWKTKAKGIMGYYMSCLENGVYTVVTRLERQIAEKDKRIAELQAIVDDNLLQMSVEGIANQEYERGRRDGYALCQEYGEHEEIDEDANGTAVWYENTYDEAIAAQKQQGKE